METLLDDRDDRDDRSLSQKASFPSPFFALSREDCLGVREFSPKWRQRRSSTLLYLWKRYRNTSACTTNFQRIKNKFTRLNCWRKIGEKFDVDAAEAEKKYKNIRTAYGRYLKKKHATRFALRLTSAILFANLAPKFCCRAQEFC